MISLPDIGQHDSIYFDVTRGNKTIPSIRYQNAYKFPTKRTDGISQ